MVETVAEESIPKLPGSDNPKEWNKQVVAGNVRMETIDVPPPFLLASVKQGSGLKHFHESTGRIEDKKDRSSVDVGSSEIGALLRELRRQECEDYGKHRIC